MPNLFYTFGRAALVAIGLTFAASASAQSYSCPTGFSTIVSGADTQSVEITCGLTCPSGQTATVTGAGAQQATVSCQTGTPVDVAPAGCKLTASPTSSTAATNVTLTLSCTSGTLPINVAWSGSAPGNCLSTMDALSKTCTVSNVSQTTTWTVSQFSNTVGNGSGNQNKSATFTFVQGGGGGFASCPSGTTTVPNGWGSNLTPQFTEGSIWSYELPVSATAGTRVQTSSWNYYSGGGGSYEYNVSETACDFSGATDITYMTTSGTLRAGQKLHGFSGNGIFSFSYKAGGNMVAGKTYYLNIKASSCPSCGELGQLPKP